MPERTAVPVHRSPVAASGTVHWVGTGLSTGPTGFGLLCDDAARVLLWGRTAERSANRLAAMGLTGRAEPRGLSHAALAAELRHGDVVVSMLPAAEHAALLRLCIDRSAHFACSSYVSETILAEAEEAAAAGLVVLTEAGLDPGIDHLMAHRLVAHARQAMANRAAEVVFTSYCGGIPAEPNEFRYRFSWAPYGVLTALGSPARFIADGTERTVDRPWTATRPLRLGSEEFEAYPNRDSIPFIAQYGLPEGWSIHTFVRGTLRHAGWRKAWEPVFETVSTGDAGRIAQLAGELAARYPTTPADRDRVVLSVALRAKPVGAPAGDPGWYGAYLLDVTGDARECAMARCVSLPLAYGTARILAGALPPGVNRAAEDFEESRRWMAFLERHGLAPGVQGAVTET